MTLSTPLAQWVLSQPLSLEDWRELAEVCASTPVSVAAFAAFCHRWDVRPDANNKEMWPYFARAAERMARIHRRNLEDAHG